MYTYVKMYSTPMNDKTIKLNNFLSEEIILLILKVINSENSVFTIHTHWNVSNNRSQS